MRLSKKELAHIKRYLDFKELTQVDLRNEVVDHMASNIENFMMVQNASFKDAFEKEIKLWENELNAHSSFWIGWYWVGPKIMIQKCAKQVKQMYLLSFCFATFLFLISYLSLNLSQVEIPTAQIQTGIGVIYLGYFVFILFGFFKLKASNFESTYRHLYKINAIGYTFMYLIFNPLWNNSFNGFGSIEDSIFVALLHAILLVFGYQFLSLYRKHFNDRIHAIL